MADLTSTLKTKIALRRGLESEWQNANPVLVKGEAAYSSDVRKLKIGDGTSKWSALKYINNTPEEISALIAKVEKKISASDAMVFIGTLGNEPGKEGTITELPTKGVKKGHTYKVIQEETWANYSCKIGDLLIAMNNSETEEGTTVAVNWAYVPSGDEKETFIQVGTNPVLSGTVKLAGSGATTVSQSGNTITIKSTNTTYTGNSGIKVDGTVIKHTNAVTAGTASGSSGSVGFGGSITIPSVTYDAQGHITDKSSTTVTLPSKPGDVSKLTTARAIDGVNFDGSAAITHFGTCSTEAATAEKVVNLAGFILVVGARITVKFTVTNTVASPTLNVNGTGAKPIYYRGSAISTGLLAANRTYEFIYDGTSYNLVGDINTDTNTDTKVTSVDNHYVPSGGTTLSASGGTVKDITNGSGVQVITGVTKDKAGHITGVTSAALKSINTDTHYISKNIVGSSNTAASNVTVATNNPYLNHIENGNVTSTHRISGSGATTVKTDTSGNIIISSTDTKPVYYSADGVNLKLNGTQFNINTDTIYVLNGGNADGTYN